MFGLEILDVVIGLMFVYLLLSLLATALNEYVSAVLNLRGRELARGLGRLLDDLDEKGAVQNALDGVGKKLTTQSALLTEQFYNHRLIRPYATRRGRFGRFLLKIRGLDEKPRLPSYMPARTFALALLDILGVDDKDAKLGHLFTAPEGKTLSEAVVDAEKAALAAEATATSAKTKEALKAAADARLLATKAKLAQVLAILKHQSSRDLTEHLGTLGTLPQADKLASALQVQVAGLLADSQTQLQKLHDGVEIWFNNSMDRVSGAYKRNIQGWLFAIGLLIASCSNADTVDMWRRLSTNDELASAMARRAGVTAEQLRPIMQPGTGGTNSAPVGAPRDNTSLPGTDTGTTNVPKQTDSTAASSGGSGDSTTLNLQSASTTLTPGTDTTTTADTTRKDPPRTAVDSVAANYEAARARLDSMELKLGWTTEEGIRIGVLKKDAAPKDSADRRADRGRVPTAPKIPVTPSPGDSAQVKKSWVPAGHHLDFFPFDTHSGPFFGKVLGLLLTAIAISLGAPFWFDMLNKVISIRGAGRSPEEKPKSPQAPAKRAGEERPK